MKKITVVSEIGSNHNGDIDLAKKMIEVSVACGADAVKFQTFKTDEVVSIYAPMAEYQVNALKESDSQKKMLRKLELSFEDYRELFAFSRELGVEMFSTPFDMQSVEFLFSMGMKIWKIPSGEITNLPFLEKIAALPVEDKHIVLSTGMASVDEVDRAVEILKDGCSEMTIMHCNTNYPSRDEDLHLRAIFKLQERYPKCNIGLSDHSAGITGVTIACGMGVTMLEKHFTLSHSLPGPDHMASIIPEELEALCTAVRRAEVMLGGTEKVVTESEAPNRLWARKSIVARRAIEKGETFTEDNITCKRPGTGISPMNWYEVLGRKAERSFGADELIEVSDIMNQ